MAKPKISVIETEESTAETPATIAKPEGGFLDKFKSKKAATIANVETLLPELPVHKIPEAKDFVRLHPDEQNYWSSELCFVNVPIKGSRRDTLHLIAEDLGTRFLDDGRIQRFRLALASKPHDVFFLALVPTQNKDNSYNRDNLEGCELAKTTWVQLTSRRNEGVDGYKISKARDPNAFPEPNWPSQTLDKIVERRFTGINIDREDHPGLLRLIGARQTP
jgi:hypothetical protein